MSTGSLKDQTALAQGRWTLALLTDLAAHNGARFVELLNRTGVARDSLSRTLEAAAAQGWVERNPGYGHPLRPEYILTTEGKRMALLAAKIDNARTMVGVEPGGLARWSMPVICSIHAGNRRFNELSRALPTASPRALSQALRNLAGQQLLVRELVEGYPPASLYSLTGHGMTLANAA